MSRASAILKLLLLCAAVWLCGEVAWSVRVIRPKVQVTLQNVDRTVIIAGAAATHLEKAAGEWQNASKTQARETTEAMQSISQTSKAYGDLARTTGRSLNTLLLTANSAVEQQNNSLLAVQKALSTELVSMQMVSAQAQQTLLDMDKQISSPDVTVALDNFAASSKNLATATSEGAATMASVRKGVDYEVREITKPISAVKKALLFVAGIAGRLFGL